jgi:single-stranded-DNA-specific exonuclease
MDPLDIAPEAGLEPWNVRSAHLPPELPLREKLLLLRGLPPGPERDLFLHPEPHRTLNQLLGDPTTLPDMPQAVERLRSAVETGEKICVYGDYDADGVTATAILVRGLRCLGSTVEYYIPHRVDEGFGLHESAIQTIAARGATLLVTVDCGTSDDAEVLAAQTYGIDIIITDHHSLPSTLPEAVAVVNPNRSENGYPERFLTGAGLAYNLLRALAYSMGVAGKLKGSEYVQLAALGTIADVGRILGENRVLVRAGLVALHLRPLPGVRAMLAVSGFRNADVSETDVSFKIAPRLNAAGRMAHANLACELLLADDPTRAGQLAREVERLNESRRATTDGMLLKASGMVDAGHAFGGDVLTVYHEDWSPALLGIVAGRLSRLHGVPVIAASRDGDGVRASARSVPGLDITLALDACADLLTEHGGHAQAAGFSTSAAGLRAVHEHLLREFAGSRKSITVEVDAELRTSDLSSELVHAVAALAPFGGGNPEPLFGLRRVHPRGVRVFGKQRAHLTFDLPGTDGVPVEVVAFGMADRVQTFGGPVDLVVRTTPHMNGSALPLRLCLEHVYPAQS